MKTIFRNAAMALSAAGLALPAAASAAGFALPGAEHGAYSTDKWEHKRDRGKHRGWYNGRGHDRDDYDRYRYRSYGYYQPARTYYVEPMYRDTRVWRGNDGRYYCRRRDGTTGLVVGAAAGALIGRSIDNHGDRTLGTILGAAVGALIGKEVEQGGCR